jgi:hypothetical protein
MEYNMASASELYPIMAGTSKWFVYGPGNTKVAGPFKSQEEAEAYIKSAKSSGASFFKNGADRARLEIQNKLVGAGFKVENVGERFIVKSDRYNESWYVYDTELKKKASGTTYPQESSAIDEAARLNEKLMNAKGDSGVKGVWSVFDTSGTKVGEVEASSFNEAKTAAEKKFKVSGVIRK